MSTIAVLALAAVSVVACSDPGGSGASEGSATARSSVSATAASAAASASASALASASASGSVDPAQVTPESLSDEELGYTVTSVPEGMDATQAEIVQAYAAYSRFTWRLWLTPAGTGAGMEGAEEVMTEAVRAYIEGQYTALEPGRYLEGQVRTAVTEVQVYDQVVPETADVIVCSDRGDMRDYDASGQDVTSPDIQGRFEYALSLERTADGWRVSGERDVSRNECSV
ncbi:hypothetical protein [Actinomyces howellii]|uniref:Lipoprotein n=1 Tax=Actinomyces howellii TaxID=52771 RepID=A0A3S4RGY8_9ACTO|nr:hypothetical protein [Actinomyces howellii]VEG29816.1 Uncharacterised protein [Actinomyces howellii]